MTCMVIFCDHRAMAMMALFSLHGTASVIYIYIHGCHEQKNYGRKSTILCSGSVVKIHTT